MGKYILSILLLISLALTGQNTVPQLSEQLSQSLTSIYSQSMKQSIRIKIDSIDVNNQKKTIEIYAGVPLSYMSMREKTIKNIYDSIRSYLPSQQQEYLLNVFTDQQEITNLIPNHYRDKVEIDKKRTQIHKVSAPLTKNISSPIKFLTKGLENNHIAIWQSHGWYYNQKKSRWEWQRARIFQTVEDIYTQSYVVPFIVPMRCSELPKARSSFVVLAVSVLYSLTVPLLNTLYRFFISSLQKITKRYCRC